MVRRINTVLAAAVAVLALAGTTSAQTPMPVQGLFAPTPAPIRPHALAFVFSLSEMYGDATAIDGRPLLVPGTMQSLSSFDALLGYTYSGPAVQVVAQTQGAARYYPNLQGLASPRYSGQFELTTVSGPARRTWFRFFQSAAREPYFQAPLVGRSVSDLSLSPTERIYRDDALSADAAVLYESRAELRRRMTARNFATLSADFRHTTFDAANRSLAQFSVAPQIGRQVTRNLTLDGQYDYRRGIYQQVGTKVMRETHGVTFGFDYTRPTSKTRRLLVRAHVGVATAQTLTTGQRATVVVKVDHQMSYGWHVQADYRRAFEFVAGFDGPFYADTVLGTVGGFLTRRVSVSADGGYSRGRVGQLAAAYTQMHGSGRVRVALARIAAVDAVYLFYDGDFRQSSPLVGVAPQLRRQAIRLDLTFFLPIVR